MIFTFFKRIKKKAFLIMCAAMVLNQAFSSAAGEFWPGIGEDLKAGSAIVMDVDTGTVLYEKYAHESCYPASVTKLMTALLVLENCSPDETVVFSHSAVTGLESGAVNIGAVEGDKLSVRDCLYALLFHSANDVANALAEHVSGSVEEFCALMNRRAEELGCRGTDFHNPSGLTDSRHVTTAYDMALIGAACMDRKDFCELESGSQKHIGPTGKYPDGQSFVIGHKMKQKNSPYYDPRVTGGKTGYITASGNTLVTMAEDGGRRIVAVVLKDKNPWHYKDTARLLDLGFGGFEKTEIRDPLTLFDIERRLINDKIITEGRNSLKAPESIAAVLPAGADINDVVPDYDYNTGSEAPENAVASLRLRYAGVAVSGRSWIINEREPDISLGEMDPGGEEQGSGKASLRMLIYAVTGILVLVLSGAAVFLIREAGRNRRDKEKRMLEKRQERLKRLNMTEEEFIAYMERYRQERQSRGKGEED